VTEPATARWAGPLRAVGWTTLFLTGGTILTLVLVLAAGLVVGLDRLQSATPFALSIQSGAGLLGFGLMTWVIGRRALGLTWTELRWAPIGRARTGFPTGIGLGAAPAALAMLASVPVAGAAFLRDAGGVPDYLVQLARTVVVLAPAALLEEVVFRGVGQVALARAFGRWPAIIVMSLIFALAHAENPNPTVLGLANIGLAGLFLAVVFYTPGGIWAAWGAHLGWNATLAAFDAPVSGLPFAIPLIDYRPGGPAWLDGGSFGPEGGLLASIAITLAVVAVGRWVRKETA
jgi:CAAX protease family protein